MRLQLAIFGYWSGDMDVKSHILYGVLNWGLGHATRSVPVIQALIREGFTPVIASDGAALQYLCKVFPDLPYEELPAYDVRYSEGSFIFNMITQLPRIGKAIRQERSFAVKLVKKYHARGIISDNRMGFYFKGVPSAFITHQLNILLPFPASVVNAVHHRYINKFTQCWVPDFEGEARSLAGKLTHSRKPSVPVHYLGPLSQIQEIEEVAKKYDAVAILSGPEPQRSILEASLLKQLEGMTGNFILVRGTLNGKPLKTTIPYKDIIGGGAVAQLVSEARLVIGRSGYSSLMDYYILKNKALLIPTPGQVEQEYLAKHLRDQKIFYAVDQGSLDLERDMVVAMEYPGFVKDRQKDPDWQELFGLFKSKGES
ncbi:MAG: glycosyltransferase [Owenweeksia sp.]